MRARAPAAGRSLRRHACGRLPVEVLIGRGVGHAFMPASRTRDARPDASRMASNQRCTFGKSSSACPWRSCEHDPRPAGDVGDRIIAGEVGAVGETAIHHAVQAIDLVRVPLDAVRHDLQRRTRGSDVPGPPSARARQPASTATAAPRIAVQVGRQSWPDFSARYCRIAPDSKMASGPPLRVLVHDGRDAVVRADAQEVGRELRATQDVDLDDAIRQPHSSSMIAILSPFGDG